MLSVVQKCTTDCARCAKKLTCHLKIFNYESGNDERFGKATRNLRFYGFEGTAKPSKNWVEDEGRCNGFGKRAKV